MSEKIKVVDKLFNSIDYDSLSLFREMMKDRYGGEND